MDFSRFDHECMALALRLAENGLYTTHPNPRVGSVIADAGRIVGRGWHRAAGEAHAEIAALEDAGPAASGATAYVTLEPCSHQGRTASCADALLEAGIVRVVGAVADPYPEVDGAGFERLRQAGIQVDVGLMEAQARELNAGFFSRMERGRPWVRVKSAQSLDGRTALGSGESQWITSDQSRRDVQRWRARSDALLTGVATVLADDPRMTVREFELEHQPLRVIADSGFRIDPGSRILDPADTALVVGCSPGSRAQALEARGVECLVLEDDGAGRVNMFALLQALAERSINEVQVEAGARLCGALLEGGLVDEILIYQAPCLLGLEAPPAFALGPLESMAQRVHLEVREIVSTGPDWRIRLHPRKGS